MARFRKGTVVGASAAAVLLAVSVPAAMAATRSPAPAPAGFTAALAGLPTAVVTGYPADRDVRARPHRRGQPTRPAAARTSAPASPRTSALASSPASVPASSPAPAAATAPASAAATTPAPARATSSSAPATAGCTQTYSASDSSTDRASCGPYANILPDGQGSVVGQDVWNPQPGESQVLTATSDSSWSVVANLPAGETGVASYPDVGEQVNSPALSSFTKLTSSWNVSTPTGTSQNYDTGYDIWMNDWANEVMIQMNNNGSMDVNSSACPYVANVTFGGSDGVPSQTWGLCVNGSFGSSNAKTPEEIWQLKSGPEPTGSVDILAMMQWLESHDPAGKSFTYIPSSSTLTDIGFGFELCSTDGTNQTFKVNDYSISYAQG